MKDGNYQILHVEDNEARYTNYCGMVGSALNKAGIQYELHWVRTVSDATKFILNYRDCLDLILLDISLTKNGSETGLDLVNIIWDSKICSSIPIFVVSSNVSSYKHEIVNIS